MVTATGSYAATAPQTSGQWIMQMVAFKAAATTPAATYNISGTVSGAAATVTLSGASSATTTVAAGGTYTFAGLKNGSYTVAPTQSGFSFSPASTAVTVNGQSVSNINFTGTVAASRGTYSISGKVTGSAATVTLSGVSSAKTTVAAGGTYTFSGLANGSYVLNASATGFSFAPTSALETVNNANITGVNFTATALPPTVTLSWTASTSPNISGYDVYRGTASGGPYSLLNSSLVAGTSYVDKTVLSGHTYYYVATAVNSSNTQSGNSNQAVAVVP